MTSVSIVIPMHNEADNVAPLVAGIVEACTELEGDYEILIVDDGSTDATAEKVQALMPDTPALRLLRHDRSGGQSAAVHSGVQAAKGGVVCTLDGDGQNPPSELPKLYRPLLVNPRGVLALVAGQRVDRRDTVSKRLASRIANAIRSRLLDDGTRDTGCGLKGFRRDAFLALPYFDHMHRYLPALFKRDGWQIALVDVAHSERMSGRSKYNNLQRGLVGIYDLIGVSWLIRRRKKARIQEDGSQ